MTADNFARALTAPLLAVSEEADAWRLPGLKPQYAASECSCVDKTYLLHGNGVETLRVSPPSQTSAAARCPADPNMRCFAAQLKQPLPQLSSKLSWLRRLWAFNGPGWLMMIAYIDPGNLEADLQCGALFNYSLLWALLLSTLMGLGMQLVAMRLGTVTHRHLAMHCRDHYPPLARIALWLATELVIIGSDLQEVIGCAIGLQLLFGLPLWMGVMLAAGLAFLLLLMSSLGTRKLEALFGVLIALLTSAMLYLFVMVAPDHHALLQGLLEPELRGGEAWQQVVGMVGSVIMPHNLFLHSALVYSRSVEGLEAESGTSRREAVSFYTIESTVAIGTSLLINTACVAVFARGFHGSEIAAKIGLRNAGDYLGMAYGAPFSTVWALGLVASGQSSTMTGMYAGQWVMQGYLDLKVAPWKRALITRSCALVPALAVAILCHKESQIDVLNGYLNILQALVLPFALVPLILFASSRAVMGEMVLQSTSQLACWSGFLVIMAANLNLIVGQQESVSLGLLCGVGLYTAAVAFVVRAPLLSLKRRASELPPAAAAPKAANTPL